MRVPSGSPSAASEPKRPHPALPQRGREIAAYRVQLGCESLMKAHTARAIGGPMAKNPLFELYEAGTSVWLDYIRRSLMTSGELERMIDEDAVVGMTSNPTIFEKAIGGSSDYDDALRHLVDAGTPDEEIMLSLIVEDIQMAADVLKPVYARTRHKDGYVSIEVLPRVADDSQRTIA